MDTFIAGGTDGVNRRSKTGLDLESILYYRKEENKYLKKIKNNLKHANLRSDTEEPAVSLGVRIFHVCSRYNYFQIFGNKF